MKIYAGTSGFAHKEWKGKFYPEKIAPKDMLRYYATRMNTVEINNTFYHMPTPNVLLAWAEQAPPGFVFSVKAPQLITHIKRLHNVADETKYVFQTLRSLDTKRGPLLFQFPKTFRADAELLRNFFAVIPAKADCAFEFRNPALMTSEVADLLREKGCSLCIADTDEAPVEEITSTTNWGYLRLRRSAYGETDLSAWADRILAQHWDRAFVYFKHEDEARGAELAMRFQALVDSRANDGLQKTG
jgi:uncharacterized protein YecE (DUF72 family)